MHISSQDRLGFRDVLFDTREGSRLSYLVIPVLVRDDYDIDTGSGDDISEGNGLGQVAGQFRIYAVRVHFRSVDAMLMTFGHVPPGVVLGDALVNFGPRDLYAFKQAMADDNSYLLIDGEPYHIISILAAGVGQIEEYAMDARKFSPLFRAPGY